MSEKPDPMDAVREAHALLVEQGGPDPLVTMALLTASKVAEPSIMAPAAVASILQFTDSILVRLAVEAEVERRGGPERVTEGDLDAIILGYAPDQEAETHIAWLGRIGEATPRMSGEEAHMSFADAVMDALIAGVMLGNEMKMKTTDILEIGIGVLHIDGNMTTEEQAQHMQDVLERARQDFLAKGGPDDEGLDEKEDKHG